MKKKIGIKEEPNLVGRCAKKDFKVTMFNYIDGSLGGLNDLVGNRDLSDFHVQKDVLVYILDNYKEDITTRASWKIERCPQKKK